MAKKNLEVIKQELEELFVDSQEVEPAKVSIAEYDHHRGRAVVEKMYEYVDIQFSTMMRLREIFGGEFNIDQESHSGCETCDYGSSYRKEFIFERKDIPECT